VVMYTRHESQLSNSDFTGQSAKLKKLQNSGLHRAREHVQISQKVLKNEIYLILFNDYLGK